MRGSGGIEGVWNWGAKVSIKKLKFPRKKAWFVV